MQQQLSSPAPAASSPDLAAVRAALNPTCPCTYCGQPTAGSHTRPGTIATREPCCIGCHSRLAWLPTRVTDAQNAEMAIDLALMGGAA